MTVQKKTAVTIKVGRRSAIKPCAAGDAGWVFPLQIQQLFNTKKKKNKEEKKQTREKGLYIGRLWTLLGGLSCQVLHVVYIVKR